MQADNNLSSYAFADLEEMASSLEADGRLRIFVHLDLPGDGGLREFEIRPGAPFEASVSEATVLSETGKKQTERLTDFLFNVEEIAPSHHTMLVIWGHGEGWSSGPAQFGGVALDDYPAGRMTARDILGAVKARNELAENKLNVLAMDACLMQTIEVAYVFRNEVNYYVGSAQTQNFKGLPYNLINDFIQKELAGIGSDSSSEEDYFLAQKIPALFANAYIREGEFDSETMSSVSAKELENAFLPSFYRAMSAINVYLKKRPFEIFSLKQELSLTPFFMGNSRDIDTLLAKLEKFFYDKRALDVFAEIASTRQALSYSVLSYTYGPNYFDSADHGYFPGAFKAFGIWFPSSKLEYLARISDFEQSEIFQTEEFAPYTLFLSKLFAESIL